MNTVTNDPDRLYQLLPAVYRERDEAEGLPLRALLRIIADQDRILYAGIGRLWDNFFIETCDRWAIPYLGDLVGNNLLHDTHRLATPDTARALFTDLAGRELRPPIAIRTRADVAKTIYYRRRKGTLPMLEELARDVTGWPVYAVEFFELLGWTQWVRNHRRMHCLRTPDIRRIEPMDRLNGPFDFISHTVDVRPISQQAGWYNIKNIGFFVWRLGSYPMSNVRARPVTPNPGEWRFHFSPLGNPAPLLGRWRREGDEAGLATELHVPAPIRCPFFYEDLKHYQNTEPPRPDFTDFYGLFAPINNNPMVVFPDASFFIFRNAVPVHPAQDPNASIHAFEPQIVSRRLDPWPDDPPTEKLIAIDIEHGRIAVGANWEDETESLDVYYHYGFSADLGGGPYERGKWLVRPELADLHLEVGENASLPQFSNMSDAFQKWVDEGRPNAIITILDNRTYEVSGNLQLAADRWIVIQADNKQRPHVRVPDAGELQVVGQPRSELTLSGILFEGGIRVTGDLGRLRVIHSTLVPGRGFNENGKPLGTDPSLTVEGGSVTEPLNAEFAELRVEIAFSVTGPLQLPEHANGLWVLDSIVDGIPGQDGGLGMAICGSGAGSDPSGPPASLERVTIIGGSRVKKLLLASEVIFTDPVVAIQRQEGCVRFSFVPHESVTPRRYRCQPDLEITAQLEAAEKEAEANNTTLTTAQREAIRDEVRGWLAPSFTSERYGDPAYAQLHLTCPMRIHTGAEDGSEMGAFCHLKQPQRETNLRTRLEEYLSFGLEPGIIYVT